MNIKFNYVDANYKPYDMSGAKIAYVVINTNNPLYTPQEFDTIEAAQEFINEQFKDDLNRWTVLKNHSS